MPRKCPRQAGSADCGGQKDSIGPRMWKPWCDRALARRSLHFGGVLSAATALSTIALAEGSGTAQAAGLSVSTVEVMQAAVFAGVMGAALLSAIWLIRERARTAAENTSLRARVADLNASLQRSEALLNLRDQRVLVWANDKAKPEVVGALAAEVGAPEERGSLLAFGRWLAPRSAAALEQAIGELRGRGVAFDLVVETAKSAPLEIQGRKTATHTLVRFLSLSQTQRTAAHLK